MNLDARTVILTTAFGAFAMSVVLLITTRRYSDQIRGMKQWSLAYAIQFVGWALLGLRGRIPDFWSIFVANALIAFSLALLYHALKRFKRVSTGAAYAYGIAGAAGLLIAFFWFIAPHFMARVYTMSAASAVLSFMSARVVLGDKEQPKPFSHLLTGTAFLICGMIVILRALSMLLVDGSMSGLFAGSPLMDAFFVCLPGAAIVFTFNFILMCNDAANAELVSTLTQLKTLSGLLPICASCKKIRDGEGSWQHIEVYLADNSSAQFTHSICPGCAGQLYPDYIDGK